jgi:hypothetical protein
LIFIGQQTSIDLVELHLLKCWYSFKGITAGDVDVGVLKADGSKGKGVVRRHFAMLAVEGRSSSKSDFRTVKLNLLLLLLLSVEHEKNCSNSLIPIVACFL